MNVNLHSQQQSDLVHAMYRVIDERDAQALGVFLDEKVVFQLGNFEPVRGRDRVIGANEAFFETIADMSHTIDDLWVHDHHTICAGSVLYTRLDATRLSIPFATILTMEKGQVIDYRVFADISEL